MVCLIELNRFICRRLGSGPFSTNPRVLDAVIHGLLAWSLITLLTFYLVTTTIGSIIGGVGSLVGNTLSTVGGAAGNAIDAAAPAVGDKIKAELQQRGIDLGDIKREAQQILRQTGKPALQPKKSKATSRTGRYQCPTSRCPGCC